ncbi:MAG: hypothetical protein V3R52_06770, partial [Candidatus Neomarinimicrobiota bacterium]
SILAQPRGYKKTRMQQKSFGAIGMRKQGPQGFGQHSDRMEMMMTWRLTEELELTPDQADRFFPRMKAHRDNMESIESELRETVKDARRKIEDGKEVTDSDFNNMFGKVAALEKQKVDEKTRFITELNGILDNTQRIKLTMFKTKFAKEMQEQIRRKRSTKLK